MRLCLDDHLNHVEIPRKDTQRLTDPFELDGWYQTDSLFCQDNDDHLYGCATKPNPDPDMMWKIYHFFYLYFVIRPLKTTFRSTERLRIIIRDDLGIYLTRNQLWELMINLGFTPRIRKYNNYALLDFNWTFDLGQLDYYESTIFVPQRHYDALNKCFGLNNDYCTPEQCLRERFKHHELDKKKFKEYAL